MAKNEVFKKYKALTVEELRDIASDLKIKYYYKMREDALIDAIMKVTKPAEKEANKPRKLKQLTPEEFDKIKDKAIIVRTERICPTCKTNTLDVVRLHVHEYKCTKCGRGIIFTR